MTKKASHDQNWMLWAAQAQGGDKRAYHQLLSAITPFIRAYAAPGLANADWLDDLVQNVLISVHKALPTYDPARPFKPWLIALIQFRRTDLLRSHYRQQDKAGPSLDDETIPDDGAIMAGAVTFPAHAGEYKDMEAALARLSPQARRLIILTKVYGYSMQEAALRLDISESAAKVGVHRALKKLKEEGLDNDG